MNNNELKAWIEQGIAANPNAVGVSLFGASGFGQGILLQEVLDHLEAN